MTTKTTRRTGTASSTKGAPRKASTQVKVLVGLSGGIDSAVAAALLKSEGYEVEAVHLQLIDEEKVGQKGASKGQPGGAQAQAHATGSDMGQEFWSDPTRPRCYQAGSAETAKKVAAKIGIPFHRVDVSPLFREFVLDYFIHEAVQNRAPMPCVPCNTELRMASLAAKADQLGIKYIATGHFAQLAQESASGTARLLQSADPEWDQSRLLFQLDQKVLSRCLMPLGGLTKSMVRKLCEQFGLPAFDSAGSGRVCGYDTRLAVQLVERFTPPMLRARGIMRTIEGKVVGSHIGLHNYRVGDRVTGVDLSRDGGQAGLFVTGFDNGAQSLIVGPEKGLLNAEFLASKTRWVKPVDGLRPLRCLAGIAGDARELSPCLVTQFENDMVHVKFEQPQRAVAPGKPLVFVENEEIIGGAFIEQVIGVNTPASGSHPTKQA